MLRDNYIYNRLSEHLLQTKVDLGLVGVELNNFTNYY